MVLPRGYFSIEPYLPTRLAIFSIGNILTRAMSGPGLYLFAGAFLYWISGELRKISIKHKSTGPCHPIMARSDGPGRRIIGMAAKGKKGSPEETIQQITQSKLQAQLILYAVVIIETPV